MGRLFTAVVVVSWLAALVLAAWWQRELLQALQELGRSWR